MWPDTPNVHCPDPVNVIGILALVVAITGTMIGILVFYVNSHVTDKIRKIEKLAEEMKCDAFFLARNSENAIRLFLRLDEMAKKHHVLLSWVLNGRVLPPTAYASYLESYLALRRATDKVTQTLVLYSSQTEWRQSALKQLSEDLGGADTLRALLELEKHEKDLPSDLKRAIKDLQARLDEPRRASKGSSRPPARR